MGAASPSMMCPQRRPPTPGTNTDSHVPRHDPPPAEVDGVAPTAKHERIYSYSPTNAAIRLVGPPDHSSVGARRRAGGVDPTRLDPEHTQRPQGPSAHPRSRAPSRGRRRRGREPVADLLGKLARHKGPEAVRPCRSGCPETVSRPAKSSSRPHLRGHPRASTRGIDGFSELAVVQRVVQAAARQQLCMVAVFHDASGAHDDDGVGVPDSG